MTISLGDTTLVATQERNTNGDPMGPENLRIVETPGVEVREFVGADRVQPEHIRCNSGMVSFGATRTFQSPDEALAYLAGDYLDEEAEGELKFNDTTVFGEKSVVQQRTAALVGCTVRINYQIAG